MLNKVIESQAVAPETKETPVYSGVRRTFKNRPSQTIWQKKDGGRVAIERPPQQADGVLEDRRHFQRRHPRMF
jgi:hypothetical protein